jgi:hypothetical protein
MLALCVCAQAQERISLSPYETATGSSPFLQNAFPQRTEVVRSVVARGDYELVHYEVRVFSDPDNRPESHSKGGDKPQPESQGSPGKGRP